ncbi:MAG: alpha/beta fold hydrolase [Mogibacterium sp.]|nr:alpha/beta fold hydrolase [Mogibacterium sp.]
MEYVKISKENGQVVPCVAEFPEKPEGVVVAVHGFSSNKECMTYQLLLRRLPAAGFGVVGIDLPGHGKDEAAGEELRIAACLDSIAAAERYAAERFPGLPIGYFASSFGAYLTGLYISTRPHRGRRAFFRSAAVNMPTLLVKEPTTDAERQMLADLNGKGYFDANLGTGRPIRISRGMYHDLETTDLFALFDLNRYGENRVAMAHGTEDRVIDPAAARRFAEQFDVPLTMFHGEGHSLSDAPDTPDRVADLAIALYKEA